MGPLKMTVFPPFFTKNGGKSFLFSYSREDTAIALAFIMYDCSWTNYLSVIILFHN